MSEILKNVIIIGASGNLGPSVLSALDSNPKFTVSILSRRSSSAEFPSHLTIHRISDQYPEDELERAFEGQDAIVNMAPITEVKIHKTIIDAAIKAHVRRIILSEFGTNIPELQTTEPVPIYQGKIEITEYMKSREGEGLTWTGLVVGAFLDWGLKTGLLGFSLPTHTATLISSGTTPTNVTLLSTTAFATAAILSKPKETANRYLFINSFHVTQNDIFSALKKALPGEWKVTHETCAEESRLGRALMEKGDWSGVGHAIMGASYSGGKYDFAQGRGLDNGLLGVPEERGDLDDIVAKVVRGEEVW